MTKDNKDILAEILEELKLTNSYLKKLDSAINISHDGSGRAYYFLNTKNKGPAQFG